MRKDLSPFPIGRPVKTTKTERKNTKPLKIINEIITEDKHIFIYESGISSGRIELNILHPKYEETLKRIKKLLSY